ncbi:hypothetical protein NLU13_0216 [Sarocladium strictum]|uniref:DNA polymerase n=1 Tax=Sarocladium strictum TaxID=5046 RepID=A0AA39GNN1_SARSR|nr:hypothetical protein NLU13_0216 [Sarocladium strictum]
MDLFRLRLNCIDHYQATPTRYDPQLRKDIRPSQVAKGPKVPVVRVFGSTETGQKVCAHIHGAFPYLYVEYDGGLAQDEVGAFIYRLHLSIDHALAVSYRRDQYGENARFVARITLVKGVPFYGFHVGYRYFLKIYMFNPIVMTRLADLLQQGAVMKRKFQPYEAHLQYLLQFMTDYNLYGCDYLDTYRVKFRAPVPDHDEGSNSSHLWHSWSVSDEQVTDEPGLPRVSHCSIEVDICVQDILNRKIIKERQLHHDFVERINPVPGDMKLVHSMAGLWRDETKRRKRQMPLHEQGASPFPPDVLISMSANPRESDPQGWIHEEEYRDQIQQLINQEQEMLGRELNFDNFTSADPLEPSINTALQAVEDLHPSSLMPVLGLPSAVDEEQNDIASSIEVDDTKVTRAVADDDDFFPDDSDEEAIRELANAQQVKVVKVSTGSNHKSSGSGTNGARSSGSPDRNDWRTYSGICESGFQTGQLPTMPFSDALLDIADNEGLIGRAMKPLTHAKTSMTGPKRPDAAPIPQVPQKRAHDEINLKTPDFSKNEIERFSTSPSLSTPHSLPQASRRKMFDSPNQPGSQKSASQTLNFPIVKDPEDPNTRLRLSQQSLNSPSQPDAKRLKHVSFDPSSFPKTPNGGILSSSPVIPDQSSLPPSSLLSSGSSVELTAAPFPVRSRTWVVSTLPPTADSVLRTLGDHHLPDVLYQDAYYSNETDVPSRIREYAGREFRLEGNTVPFLPPFDPTASSPANYGQRPEAPDKEAANLEYGRQGRQCSWRSWEIAQPPPSYQEVVQWMNQKEAAAVEQGRSAHDIRATQKAVLSQIDGATPKNKHGFKYTQKPKATSVEHEVSYMSTMSLEVHVNTRGKFVPNPEEDEVQCVFWALKSDETVLSSQDSSTAILSGIVILDPDGTLAPRVRKQVVGEVVAEETELDLMTRMIDIVRNHDPDILTGYEVHGSSWGYLIERARFKYDYNLCDEFSRMRSQSHGRFGKENDRWGFNTTSTIRVTGRHMINVWRAMRGELNLLQYTMENVAWHLLHRRIPHYAWKALTSCYKSGKSRDLNKVIQYYQVRTKMDIEILEANELIARTSEQARLLGVDFFSVFSRGSQFKVESIMFRIAKPENFMLVSPNRKQVGGQNALECLPLVMEPQSAFYSSPLLVLDFQSLYPSVMIAYNLCYSTFLGRITNWRGMNKMGFTEYKRQQGLLALLKDYINITPNGMMYSKVEIRKSLLAKMLTEILETRVMVKSGMKQDKDDKTLQQLLNNRQLALKLLANVTYGYTSASFSGRMPCSEIADSIVQTARETLERAIAYIHSVERWGAEVVYGDTDSLFIYLKGRTREQAFDIGNEIAREITAQNPQPIKLKFEKVYHPCVLLAKKRYVGYKYESKDQLKPEFDAKGIETVRRDGTPAEQKIEEKALRLLFETADLSQIKAYFQKQCNKIMHGSVSVQDFCFAREVKLGTYSDKGPPTAGALISTKRMLEDARAEPQYGERVPYVVITGAPGARLIDRCVAPEELHQNPHWQLDAEYYISKNLIPPLERIFNLAGANVRGWYDEMPKIQRMRQSAGNPKKMTLESYMQSSNCLICSARFPRSESSGPLCNSCRTNVPASLLALQTRLSRVERRYEEVLKVCRGCSGLGPLEEVLCDSKDCPVFWTRMKEEGRVRGERVMVAPVIRALAEGANLAALEW